MSERDPVAFDSVVGLLLIGLAILLFIVGWWLAEFSIIGIFVFVTGVAVFYPIIFGSTSCGTYVSDYYCPTCGAGLGGAEYRQAMRNNGYIICPKCKERIRYW